MITHLRLENFKSFVDSGLIELKPLTLLVGANSSGKTSVLQSLLLYRQTIDSRDIENPLLVDGDWIALGSYEDFIHAHDKKNQLSIEVRFKSDTRWRLSSIFENLGLKELEDTSPYTIHMRSRFGYYPYLHRVYLDNTEFTFMDTGLKASINRETRYRYSTSLVFGDEELISGDIDSPYKFYGASGLGVALLARHATDKEFALFQVLSSLSYAVEEEFQRLFYVGPLREYPRRFYIASGETPQDVGLRGENAVPALWLESQKKRDLHPIIDKVKFWMKRFDVAADIDLDKIKGQFFALNFVDPHTRIPVNIADVGFGASQVLPIVVGGYFAGKNSLLLIEQPEIHLHPKAQSVLGDLLIDISKQNKILLVETHSEHILARIRRRIAEGIISPNDLAIYYFSKSRKGTLPKQVHVNGLGQYLPESLPEGFFAEDYFESLEHLKAISSKVESS